MGKKLDLFHVVGSSPVLSHFEHTQNESSDLLSFLGFGWPWENLPRSLSVGTPLIGYSSSHMESSWMPPAFRTYCVNVA